MADYQLTILIVDDNRVMREVIAKILSATSHRTLLASGHKEAIVHLNSSHIDMILMDIEMPEVDGYQLTRMIRDKYDHWIPVIFLSGNDIEQALEKGIDAGGDDYLVKPVTPVILNAKVRAMARIAQMQSKLDELNKKLEKLNAQDPLTKLLNRRALDKKLKDTWSLISRQNPANGCVSVIMLDIDHFKQFNDHYGHPEGDVCLKRVALALKQKINRSSDYVARYGGEEFVIVLPQTNKEGAIKIAEEIGNAIQQERIVHEYSLVSNIVSLSIGVATGQPSKIGYKELIKQADKALYDSKHAGRNQISFFSE